MRTAPLRHYAYVLLTVWAITAVAFAVVALIVDFPLLPVAIAVFAIVTFAGVVAVHTGR